MSSSSGPLKVGVFLAEGGVQTLDTTPLDILGLLDPEWAQVVGLPEELVAQAMKIEYFFINETGEGPHPMTSGFKIAVTHSITTCPPLNILLIGGPHPSYRPSPAVQSFLRTQYDHLDALLTVCTGYVPALYSGLLDGKTATAPRGLLPMLKKEAPQVKWTERRWVRDGKVWSSGSVGNGQEMAVGFLRGLGPEKSELIETVLGMSDVGTRGQEY